MSILRKLKSLLGVDDGGDDAERDVTVTVEHDPENEAAVKGADVEESSPSGDGDGSTFATGSGTTERTTEEADTEAEATEDVEDEESPDEVEIPDAEEPAEDEVTEEAEADADDESETADAGAETEDDADAGEPVDVLNGIGPAYAQRLGDAGVDSVAELADADAAELSDATEIAEGRIQNWIDQAADY